MWKYNPILPKQHPHSAHFTISYASTCFLFFFLFLCLLPGLFHPVCSKCFLVLSYLRGSWLLMESETNLRLKNVFCWMLARRMSKVLELKSWRSSRHAKLSTFCNNFIFYGKTIWAMWAWKKLAAFIVSHLHKSLKSHSLPFTIVSPLSLLSCRATVSPSIPQIISLSAPPPPPSLPPLLSIFILPPRPGLSSATVAC